MIRLFLLKALRRSIKLSIFIFLFSLKATGQTPDQSQLNYNGGMSARNLAGYSEWQSFTAGITGDLCQISMGFFNAINGSGTFNIFSGSGTTGPLLQAQTVGVYGAGGNYMVTFTVSASITAGQMYTFQFIPGAGIPDPYGVQVEVPGTYAGGQMGLVDPSGTYFPGFDLVFQTYVCTILPIDLIDFSAKLNDEHQAELSWTTASQFNNDFFTVERSIDAVHFETLAIVQGAGSINVTLSYSVVDEYPFNGSTYYRLKQTDFDGTNSYSRIISVNTANTGMNVIWFYNPAEGVIHFSILCADENFAAVELSGVSGKIFFRMQVPVNSDIRINTRNFPAGIYFLTARNEKEFMLKKIIIN